MNFSEKLGLKINLDAKNCPYCNGRLVLQPTFCTGDGTKYQYKKCKRCKKEVKVKEEKTNYA